MRIGKIPDQVIRLLIIFLSAGAILIILRQHFVPKSFGQLGHYRADALKIIADQPIKYAGSQVCIQCHSDIGEIKSNSYHRGLSCEVCHGASNEHANAPDEIKPILPRRRDYCSYCHNYLLTKPTGFPQVYVSYHNPDKPCISCHNPHDPTPPHVPGACSACHANIARTKAVSYHASLSCETCHETPPEHKESPRLFLPKKPNDRNFCGKCHSKTAQAPADIPRINLDEHGERYLCWQCHYPHFPEAP